MATHINRRKDLRQNRPRDIPKDHPRAHPRAHLVDHPRDHQIGHRNIHPAVRLGPGHRLGLNPGDHRNVHGDRREIQGDHRGIREDQIAGRTGETEIIKGAADGTHITHSRIIQAIQMAAAHSSSRKVFNLLKFIYLNLFEA